MSVAILGYPNVGKSSLFNTMVRGHVEVANWPGTTVEINSGRVRVNGLDITFYDLPGVYGLSGSGILEVVVKRFLLEERPNVALVLVDSTNVERSLNLAVQVMEVHDNVVIALTKLDMAHSMGIHVNVDGLSRMLGVKVIPTSMVWGLGVREVLEAIRDAVGAPKGKTLRVDYGILEPYIEELVVSISELNLGGINARWVAVKLLEGDSMVEDMVRSAGGSLIVDKARRIRDEIRSSFGRDPATLIAEYRFRYTLSVARQNVIKALAPVIRRDSLSTIDKLFLDPRTSIIVTLALVSTVFLVIFTINTGFPFNVMLELLGFEDLASLIESISLSGLLDTVLSVITAVIESTLSWAPQWLVDFTVNGVIGGLGAVLLLVPLILVASAMIAVLEDVGLLPRIAIGAHRSLCRLGLSGHSILPLTLCLGCNVAGVMSLRSIPGYWDRFKLYLLAPLIPCQARLVVFVVLAGAIGGAVGALALILVYMLSFTLLALLSYSMDLMLGVRVKPELLLEIPVMHRPIGKVIWWLSWTRVKHYLVKAGTIIFLGSLITWVLTHTTTSLNYTSNPVDSIASIIARGVTPLFKPLGVDSWEVVLALMIGFIAKELFISTLIIATGNPDPIEAISTLGLRTETIVALMTFIALYTPCLATIATVRSESRSSKIALVAMLLSLTLAYLTSITVYNLLILI